MAYTCGYPIYHQFTVNNVNNAISYTIELNGTQIYSGKVFGTNTAENVQIDISDIAREYLSARWDDLNIQVSDRIVTAFGLAQNRYPFGTFRVISDNNIGGVPYVDYQICYDYNQEYDLTTEVLDYFDYPVSLFADPRQIVFLNVRSLNLGGTGAITQYRININGEIIDNDLINVNAYTAGVFNLLNANVGVTDRVRIISSNANGTLHYTDYTILEQCPNRYAVYYVNLRGGLQSLLCYGKYTESIQSDKFEPRLYADRTDRKRFEKYPVNQFILKRYTLNTGIIYPQKGRRNVNFVSGNPENIIHLITSNKIWIHDLDNNTITACRLLENSYDVKRFRFDRPLNYTFTLEESKQYYRK